MLEGIVEEVDRRVTRRGCNRITEKACYGSDFRHHETIRRSRFDLKDVTNILKL